MKDSIKATINVAKAPQEALDCITQVSRWWSKDFEGSSSNLNDEFIIHHPDQHYSKQKLIEVVPGKRVVWLVTDSTLYWLQGDKHEWTNTKIVFEIFTRGDKTIVDFTHDGLTSAKECYAICETGWHIIITKWLLHFITYGTSSPEMNNAAEIRNQILADIAT